MTRTTTPGEELRRRIAATGPVEGPYTGDRVTHAGRVGRVAIREVAPGTVGVRFDDDPDTIAHVDRAELEELTSERLCAFCKLPMPAGRRSHARACSPRCRQAMYRSRKLAVEWAGRGRRSPEELFRLQLAKAEDAPPPMRTRGASFWACRCGTLVTVADVSCRFCGGRRPAGYLIDELAGLDLGLEL